MTIAQARLDELWDFEDPVLSAQRFRDVLAGHEFTGPERDELTTQLARALGLEGRFAEAVQVLDSIDVSAANDAVRVRVALERGRVENSAGAPDRAVSYFDRAARLAAAAQLAFLQVDALHMLAIADPVHADSWTRQAVALAERAPDARTQRWLVSLHNNLGWTLFDAEDLPAAMREFRLAAEWARRVGTPGQREAAQSAIDECARAMAGADGS